MALNLPEITLLGVYALLHCHDCSVSLVIRKKYTLIQDYY